MKLLSTFATCTFDINALQLFRQSDTTSAAALLADCPVMLAAADEVVSDPARARLVIVLRGALVDATGDGGATKILPGESAGEQSVLDGEAEQSVLKATEESELVLIDAPLAWRLIEESDGVARNLLRLLSFRVRAANMRLRRRQKLGEFYRQLSLSDGLTGLYNRAWLNDVLPRLVAGAHETREPLSLIMLDIDHFKKFNDQYGHLEGDRALRVAAQVLAGALRPSDLAVRYGGEEMMVILPAMPVAAAAVVAERLCERMREALVFEDMRLPLPHVTASFGVASLGEGQGHEALIETADVALYRAKASGRNRVAIGS